MSGNAREAILAAARAAAQARGYGGLNFRDLADQVGIKAASIHYHFPGKADLGEAVARRYREDAAADLEAMLVETSDPLACIAAYPKAFRHALLNGNRMCMASTMAAEYDDLPDGVKAEMQAFADVHVAWLARLLSAAGVVGPEGAKSRALAIYAAVAGAQLMARSRSDIGLYDALIEGYRSAGLLPA